MVSLSPQVKLNVRPVHYRDLATIDALIEATDEHNSLQTFVGELPASNLSRRDQLFLKLLRLFPQQLSHLLRTYVLEQDAQVCGFIQVSPFNRTRTTWQVDRICVVGAPGPQAGGTLLLRYCLEHIWEARTWLVEVEINHADHLSLYRHNGFQPLAQMTYWSLQPEELAQLCAHEPVLPNLLPVNTADAALLCQLDTASMPPLVRQVFDRHVQDFRTTLFSGLTTAVHCQLTNTEVIQGYVFEPQRKAAIGYFRVCLSRNGTDPHVAELTVHPAYTWLYPELLAHMAHLTQRVPPAPLYLTSADYQSEREQYLEQIGAARTHQTLLMSRSVWHKLRESKTLSLENLQLTGVLQGWQPNRTPVPGRMSWLNAGGQYGDSATPLSAPPESGSYRSAYPHGAQSASPEADHPALPNQD